MRSRATIAVILISLIASSGDVSLAQDSPSPLSPQPTPYPSATPVVGGPVLPGDELPILPHPTLQPVTPEDAIAEGESVSPLFAKYACFVASRWWGFSESICS